MRGQHPDLIVVSADEKDIGVDRVRKLIADAQVRPGLGSVRCFIVDGADLFTVPAADAFLKTLEEPPESARFFLIAEERERVLPTLRSRCGLVRYGPLPDDFVSSVVVESVGEGEETAKALICARLGEGSVGRAVGYWNSGKIALRDQVLRVLQLAVQRDWSALFSAVDAMDRDLPLALKFLEQISHDVLMVRVDPMRALNADCLDELKDLGLKASVRSWFTVSQKTRELLQQRRSTPLNLSFHFKTRLVESFLL
jgi:DNA polymerase-3 subunit delta'